MFRDFLGDWMLMFDDVHSTTAERIRVFLNDGAVFVGDADSGDAVRPVRAELADDTLRFELLGRGSARNTTRYSYELRMRSRSELVGTRRRGLLARVPITARRAAEMAVVVPFVRAEPRRPEPGTQVRPGERQVISPAVLATLPPPNPAEAVHHLIG